MSSKDEKLVLRFGTMRKRGISEWILKKGDVGGTTGNPGNN